MDRRAGVTLKELRGGFRTAAENIDPLFFEPGQRFADEMSGAEDQNARAVIEARARELYQAERDKYKIPDRYEVERLVGEINGEFLSSRFSKALGFFADDAWVADVNCPDCEKSLTRGFQGASFSSFQPAAGVELPLAKGIDVNCNKTL